MRRISASRSLLARRSLDVNTPSSFSISRRCIQSIASSRSTKQNLHNFTRENLSEGIQLSGQRRHQHAAAAQDLQDAPDGYIETDLTPEDKLQKGKLPRKKSPSDAKNPPQSNIRDRLRAWESQQSSEPLGQDVVRERLQALRIDTALEFVQGPEADVIASEEEDEQKSYKQSDDLDEDMSNYIGGQNFLDPGDIVTFRNRSVSNYDHICVFIQEMDGQRHFYDLSGRYVVRDRKASGYVARGIINPKLLKPLIPYLPQEAVFSKDDMLVSGSIPRSVAWPILKILLDFSAEAVAFYTAHQEALENIFQSLAYEEDRRYMKMEEICQEIFGKSWSSLTPPQQFAVQTTMIRSIGVTLVILNRDSEPLFTFRSAKSYRRLRNVTQWIRWYQEAAARASHKAAYRDPAPHNPLYSFIEKARKAILRSRSYRSPTTVGALGPSLDRLKDGVEVEDTGIAFSDDDQMIIEFLLVAFTELPASPNHAIKANSAMIIRAIGAYPSMDIDKNAGTLLLQELGVLSPWSDPTINSLALRLANTGNDAVADKLHQEVLTPEYEDHISRLPDMLGDIRKDWGELPVFCCDSASTIDVDDGFSIEFDPESPDSKWLHVHVADPAAFIQPNETVAKYAERVLASTYTFEHSISMLPTLAVNKRFSLAPNRPAMTISSLISSDGAVKDVRITPSIIRNVVKLTPDQLSEELWQPLEEQASFTVGKPVPKHSFPEQHAWKQYKADIYAIRELAAARLQQKREHPEYVPVRRFGNVAGLVAVDVQNVGPQELDLSRSRVFRGDPTISVTTYKASENEMMNFTSLELVSQNLVAEVMQIAGESAALWCRQRNIPILYLGTRLFKDWPASRLQEIIRSGTQDNKNVWNWPASTFSSSPIFHHIMGAEQYTRATSPLRRYGDLICHWQINSYLRAEADIALGRLDASTSPSDCIPFTSSDIDRHLTDASGRAFNLKTLSRSNETHWKSQALFRAFNFKEAELPETVNVKIYEVQSSEAQNVVLKVRGVIMEFDSNCEFEPSVEGFERLAEAGDIVPAKITLINPNFWGKITVQAVGYPKS